MATVSSASEILTGERFSEIKEAFNTVDSDRDGIIMASQLGSVLRHLGQNPTDADLQVKCESSK